MPLLTIRDLESVSPFFEGRWGQRVGRFLLRFLSVDRVNDCYDRNIGHRGADFARAVLEDIGVQYSVLHGEILERLPEGPFITISNHPYGSIDGIMLIDLFGHLRDDFRVMVNAFLGRIEPLRESFICVTPTGEDRTAPTRESIRGVMDSLRHVRSGGSLGLFPSGAVSDLSLRDGCIRDREWQESVMHLIDKLRVPIVPVHFLDRNSNFYYSLGLIDWRVRLLRLPAEVFNKRGKRTRIAIGEVITPEEQAEMSAKGELRKHLRDRVYNQY